MNQYDLVVIGSGPAGQKAAIAAAKLRKKVAVVERQRVVGGECLQKGTIPSKTLREAAMYLTGARQRELYGEAYRVKDRIKVEDLKFRTQRVIEKETDVIRDQLLRNYVDIIWGTACFSDAHKIVVTDPQQTRTLESDKFILAVGSKPARPTGIDFANPNIIDSDTLFTLKEIPRSMAIVGSGIIGVEYATILQQVGVRVTLIDSRKRPLDYLDDEIEDALTYHMRSEGVILRYGETVCGVKPTADNVVNVYLESGKQVVADVVLFAAGRVGATSGLNLEAIGLRPDNRGRLKVDETYRTKAENIYAVGDVIGFPSLASTSMEQGRIAACNAFDVATGKFTNLLPLGIYAIPEIASVGPSEEQLTDQAVPYETGVARFRELARAQIMGCSTGMLKIAFQRENLKVLAVHIMGESATELVHIGHAVMALDGTIEFFRDAVFNYPTLAEAYKVAALDGINKVQALS
ncbi:Si-specific NAD(P)(+) transhydrogenase [Acidobacteria bacterium AH-259-O06]|nr:Si-specific NAD(P)(+) transhydrogenase [Acidobacteria bacterium AH-259-O06]